MAPGRGNIAAIVDKLKTRKEWPLRCQAGATKWQVTLYSGSFNMRNMKQQDLQALREISKFSAGPLVDVAKYPFFGGGKCHPCTDSFTTFAPSSFATELNYVAPPLLVASLKLINDEHNIGLIQPSKLFGEDKLS